MNRRTRTASARALPVLAVVASLVAATSACAGPTDDGTTPTTSSSQETGQPDADRTTLELAVLDALEDDPHLKEARYEPGDDHVVVTVRTDGAALSTDELRDLEERAEQVTNGVDVVVVTTDEDAPTED